MVKLDEESLICDFMETYNLLDYKSLPLRKAALLANGLRDDSRIKMKLLGQKVPYDILLLSGILDDLNLLLWSKTKDGQKNRKRPKSIVKSLILDEEGDSYTKFNSGEDFEKERERILKKIREGGEENG